MLDKITHSLSQSKAHCGPYFNNREASKFLVWRGIRANDPPVCLPSNLPDVKIVSFLFGLMTSGQAALFGQLQGFNRSTP